MTPTTSAPASQRRIGEQAHEPDPSAAVDEAHAVRRDQAPSSAAAVRCASDTRDDEPQKTHTDVMRRMAAAFSSPRSPRHGARPADNQFGLLYCAAT
jgi:hypothetical protein